MTTRFRRPMLVLGTLILIMQALFMPVVMVYAETMTDTEEQELVELSPMKNYLEEEQVSDPRFFFTRSRMQGTVEEPLQVTFFSDQEVSEARVLLPEETTLLKDQLQIGISVEKGAQPNEWLVQSERAQHTFVLPLIVEKTGNYELSVEETTARLEINEQEEISEEVPVEEAESSEDDPAGQEELKEENGIEEEQENEQPAEGVRKPVSEAAQEQKKDEKETDEASQGGEPTVFNGETAEVSTMEEFRAAVANPDVGIISVQANLTESTGNIITVDRPLVIRGNDHMLNFTNGNFYFDLLEVHQASVFKIENIRVTKFGSSAGALIQSSENASKLWTLDISDVIEEGNNTWRFILMPNGKVNFSNGINTFISENSYVRFIEAKEIVISNQTIVQIKRGNAMMIHSSEPNSKLEVSENSELKIYTSGLANPIDFRGSNAKIIVDEGSNLEVHGYGGSDAATNTLNNTIAMTGNNSSVLVTNGSALTVYTTNAKRGIVLIGTTPTLHVEDSSLTVTSATAAALHINGVSPQLILDLSSVNISSTTGQRINLIGANPLVSMSSTEFNMNASSGRGFYLQGSTPKVLMDNSHLMMTDTGSSQGIILQGPDALLSLSNQSELTITGAGTGATENIQIGNNNARPELSVTDGSKLSVTTTSGTGAATDTANNAIHLRGADVKVVFDDGELKIDVTSGSRRGLFVNGAMADISFIDSNFEVKTSSSANAIEILQSVNGSTVIRNSKVTIPIGFLYLMTGETLEIDNSEIDSARLFHNALDVVIKNNSFVNLQQDGIRSIGGYIAPINPTAGVMGSNRFGQTLSITTGAVVSIKRSDGVGNSQGFRMGLGNSTVSVEQGGKLYIDNLGDGTPNNSQNGASNAGVAFRNGNNNKFIVKDPGSVVSIIAQTGAAITNSWGDTKFSMDLEVSNGGYFSAVSNTATTASGTFNVSTLNVNFDNPLFLDFRNLQSSGGVLFSTDSASTLTASNSDLALWQRFSNLDSDPSFNFRSLAYSFSGTNLSTLVSTSRPEELNTSVIGTSGLSQFSRLSSNNGRWAIADELRVPTNADKKIHGRVSLPVGVDESRPAWDDEAIVTVEVETPTGGTTQEYTAKTVGDTNESKGISIYGEEPRGGLFEIDLDEPLEAGSKVRISKVELTSGELTEGFEHQILTDTVEVFPIVPPTPAQFSSSIIAQDSTTIQGITENVDAEVTATHNGNPINTESVTVEADGRFTLDLSDVSLEMNDEIQVFLRDAEGSAVAAGVVNPPETNNTRGNINPATELAFHDVTFEPGTTLIVGDLGPVSPVDPLDPEVEVDPENQPELPEDQGQLSIDFVSQFNFGTQSISPTNKTYYAQPQRLLNDEGTVNDTEKRPNYVQVSDRRSENDRNGWQLAVTQNTQFTTENDHTLLGAQLQLMNQQLVTAQGGTEPSLQATNPLALVPGQKRTLIRAEGTEGTGTWIYRFGNAENAQESVALHVPKGANPHAESYRTTLTWELSAVPEN
ncbi:hypothetical protein A5882_003765 [Enterococcus sp. 4E1_DIV0656]|uniref:WxL domain-containing protein n=1 Tax=Enterococcus sp. 4E1_DIV0656 TaxID=1834180 RepID=UPI000A3BF497|nr:WxL domain-containing protein [Enterococcus sp. 4E1_DIV0656]OTO09086.1 hypothetical protein A5882_003765 [Enterococcus sp. 4E1_DIV0656]